VAGGVHTAPERGRKIGADVVQIFSKQNTRWMGKALEEEDARALREESDRTGVRVAAIHCAYLINLGSTNETVRTRSLYALEDEASRAAILGVPYLVMHPGSCGDDPVKEGISRIASAIRSFGKFPKGVTLLLENTAGQGNSIGRTMRQLRELLDGAGDPAEHLGRFQCLLLQRIEVIPVHLLLVHLGIKQRGDEHGSVLFIQA